MEQTENELIQEEQRILDSVIDQMDIALKELGTFQEHSKKAAIDAKSKSLPDAYGALVKAHNDDTWAYKKTLGLMQGKSELYNHRMIVDVNSDKDGFEELLMPVGLHTYMHKDKVYIYRWTLPQCRFFLLNNNAAEYDGIVEDSKTGETFQTHYELKLRRQVEIFFDKIQRVQHFFPLKSEEAEQLVYDAFLQELLNRRSEREFRNIVFSIQKKQGEIIQTPFKQSLIVQGCAGSGKSMIMMHRLPIILFDNEKTLSRSNLYIITPSSTYIEMSTEMRSELEIEDLNMGTINQYYNHVIKKYGRDPEQIGLTHTQKEIDAETISFVYSDKLQEYIRDQITLIMLNHFTDLKPAFDMLHLPSKAVEGKDLPQRMRSEVRLIQDILSENTENYQKYESAIKTVIQEFCRLNWFFKTRQDSAQRDLDAKIYREQEQIAKCKKEIEEAGPTRTKVYFDNRKKLIRSSLDKIIFYREELLRLKADAAYFERVGALSAKIDQLIDIYPHYSTKDSSSDISEEVQYRQIENIGPLVDACRYLINAAEDLDNPYADYTPSLQVQDTIKDLYAKVEALLKVNSPILDPGTGEKLRMRQFYLQEEGKKLVDDLYSRTMERLGQEKNKKGKYDALMCSPYIYLQILYILEGSPNSAPENMISIDEAQNLTVEELLLLKAVNKDQAVFNLYGDVHQHVEGSKGIDDWGSFTSIIPFTTYSMDENYRNARQITKYCNEQFRMNMLAINLDGSGVHKMADDTEPFEQLAGIMKKPPKAGMSCMIVKSPEEAEAICKKLGSLEKKIHDISVVPDALYPNRWNLMTVQQAKGLEFETVIVFSGRMTENEKYIAYTRALDELFVFDEILSVKPKKAILFNDNASQKIKTTESEKTKERKSRKKRTSKAGSNSASAETAETSPKEKTENKPKITVKEFFTQKGLDVIDARKSTGFMWVLGTQDTIGEIVQEAVQLFGITGSYSSGKTTKFKPGWYTKTKK